MSDNLNKKYFNLNELLFYTGMHEPTKCIQIAYIYFRDRNYAIRMHIKQTIT